MVILGIDAHERTHTVVAVDERGRKLGEHTVGTTTADHLELLVWASRFGVERRWAVEDCRHLSRRLERDLLGAGQQVVGVPPSSWPMSAPPPAPTASRTRLTRWRWPGAALREPDLPTARLDGPARELWLLVDHREDLVAERTRVITGCAGTCTSSTRPSSRLPGRCRGQRQGPGGHRGAPLSL